MAWGGSSGGVAGSRLAGWRIASYFASGHRPETTDENHLPDVRPRAGAARAGAADGTYRGARLPRHRAGGDAPDGLHDRRPRGPGRKAPAAGGVAPFGLVVRQRGAVPV